MAARTDVPASAESRPGAGLRTLVNFLLFLHLFALCFAVAVNFQPVSPVRAMLGSRLRFIRWYLQALNMDLAYNFHLTFGELEDTDHQVVAELPPAAGQAEPVIVELPSANLRPGIRRRRLAGLGFFIAERAEDDATGGLLPRAVGARLLAENQAQELTLRTRAHLQLRRESVLSTDTAEADPNGARRYMERYAARIWRDGDDFQVFKIEAQNQTAPVGEPAGGGPNYPQGSTFRP